MIFFLQSGIWCFCCIIHTEIGIQIVEYFICQRWVMSIICRYVVYGLRVLVHHIIIRKFGDTIFQHAIFYIFPCIQHFIDILADNGWIEDGALIEKDLFIYWNWYNLLSFTLFHKKILKILLVLNTLISKNCWNSFSKSIISHGKFVTFLLEMNFEWSR